MPQRPALIAPLARLIAFLTVAPLIGCAGTHSALVSLPREVRVVFVPGVAGDGPWYGALRSALTRESAHPPLIFTWGHAKPLMLLNFNDRRTHEAAETELARLLTAAIGPASPPTIDLVGHSAGCGVILGALNRLSPDVRVRRVVLLHPSVSPGFALESAIGHVNEKIWVFCSSRDTLFLKWRTSTFGTYDGVKTIAAGNVGFDISQLNEPLRSKVVQRHWNDADRRLGNDGGHSGPLAREFVDRVISPLLTRKEPISPSPPQ